MDRPWKRLMARSVKFVSLALFLVAWYVASPVFVGQWLNSAAPWAMPALQVVYWPVETYFDNPQLPGGRAYNEYIGWCARATGDFADRPPASEVNLSARTNFVITDIPLRVVADNLVSLRPIALTPEVDGDMRITLSEFASLETRLSEIEQQTGYAWEWVAGQITIGPRETIRQLAAAHDAEEKAKRFRGRIAMVFSAAAPLLFVTGVVWQFRRGRVQLLAPRVQ